MAARALGDNGNTWCIHRTPFDKDKFPVCKIGVDYHQFKGDFKAMPCLGETAEAIARCPKYRCKTPEEIAAKEKAFEERFARIGLIREAIVEAVTATGIRSGKMPCPACKTGTVSYSQASNGHVHARCSTPECAAWME